MDRVSTALIAASIESIDRVGPCTSEITLEKIQDVREARRKTIIDRAKEILHEWTIESMPSVDEIFKEVADTLNVVKVEKYGSEKLSAGPKIEGSKEIIIVEGRADVINLMRCGMYNVIAVEGAKIPDTIRNLCKKKEATAFLDGDRGGELILKELMQVSDVKYVARAPTNREVEDLNCREIFETLEKKTPIKKISKTSKKEKKIEVPEKFSQIAKDLEGTLEAVLLDEKKAQIERLPVNQLIDKLQKTEGVDTIIFDGIITGRIIDIAVEKEIKNIIASRVSSSVKKPSKIRLITSSDILKG
jgi:DNA primase